MCSSTISPLSLVWNTPKSFSSPVIVSSDPRQIWNFTLAMGLWVMLSTFTTLRVDLRMLVSSMVMVWSGSSCTT